MIEDRRYSLSLQSIRQDLTKTKFRCRLQKFGMLLIDKFIGNVRAYVPERTRAVLKNKKGGTVVFFLWNFLLFIFIFIPIEVFFVLIGSLIRRLFCFTSWRSIRSFHTVNLNDINLIKRISYTSTTQLEPSHKPINHDVPIRSYRRRRCKLCRLHSFIWSSISKTSHLWTTATYE